LLVVRQTGIQTDKQRRLHIVLGGGSSNYERERRCVASIIDDSM